MCYATNDLVYILCIDCTIDGVKDIVFVIDFPSHGRLQYFQPIREFVDSITVSLKLNSPESSVAVITFNYTVHIYFNLEAHTSLSTLSPAINPGLPYYDSYGRNTAAALRVLLSSAQNGSLGIRNETSKIAIVITDGESDDPYFTYSAAAALNAANIFDVYAIGYESARFHELNAIASDPHFVYFIDTSDVEGYIYAFERVRKNLINQLCSCKNSFYYYIFELVQF